MKPENVFDWIEVGIIAFFLPLGLIDMAGCAKPAQKFHEVNTPAAKVRSLPVQPHDMVPEPVTLALAKETPRHLELPINIAGHFPTAKECFDDRQSEECVAFWRYIETTHGMFTDCMEYQSSEETPRRCVQLYDMDGDFLVTMADWAAFDYAAPFRMWQLQGSK